MAFHARSSDRCASTSSVASGRAKKRNGTNVVPSPGRDVEHGPPRAVEALGQRGRAGARADCPPGYGSTIWPAWR